MHKKQRIEVIFNLIFGIASIIGCSTTIVFTYMAYSKTDTSATAEAAIVTLGVVTILFTILFVISSFYYIYKLSKVYSLEVENDTIKSQISDYEIKTKATSDYIYNLSYYQRQILHKLNVFLEKDKKSMKELNTIFEDLRQFFSTFTTNLQSYFTLVTADNCAITIKIVKDKKVKTFFRDAISCQARKRSDINLDGTPFIYKVSDNFAFRVITSHDYREVSYFNNDLKCDKEYENINVKWQELYNSTAVVPISLNMGDYKSEVLGFLCVDNFKGNLSHKAIEGFLCSSASLLYSVFYKLEKIITFANQNDITNDTVTLFNDWNNS